MSKETRTTKVVKIQQQIVDKLAKLSGQLHQYTAQNVNNAVRNLPKAEEVIPQKIEDTPLRDYARLYDSAKEGSQGSQALTQDLQQLNNSINEVFNGYDEIVFEDIDGNSSDDDMDRDMKLRKLQEELKKTRLLVFSRIKKIIRKLLSNKYKDLNAKIIEYDENNFAVTFTTEDGEFMTTRINVMENGDVNIFNTEHHDLKICDSIFEDISAEIRREVVTETENTLKRVISEIPPPGPRPPGSGPEPEPSPTSTKTGC